MKRLDDMRGFACLMVVAFHAVGSEPTLRGSLVGSAIQLLGYVRMPLFIAITGFIYGYRRDAQVLSWEGWTKRTSRLVPPFVLLTLVCSAIDWEAGRSATPIRSLFYGMWHLWYLQALAVVLIVVYAGERAFHPGRRGLWLAALVAAAISAGGLFGTVQILSIDRSFYLLPHFLFGVVLGYHGREGLAWPMRLAIYVAGVVALAFAAAGIQSGTPWAGSSLIGVAIGWATVLSLSRHMPSYGLLTGIGRFSLPIFLWHLPLAAVLSAVLLHRVHLAVYVAVLLRVVVGIVTPMVAVLLAERYAPGAIIFIGRRSPVDRSPVDGARAEATPA
ncbi:acyltransferase [Sphingomonas sp. KR1UV-12]|uniref:Acyltransferase n=1 Tax=Sphingomonas aurea TaxID=3063994 RepID=A0ABT9ELS9_9SPHN|nr:acyltransferase [Sphingomonas sp. KR1UV-12]MDP1027910.1 acyltransferase [Sphingomonas sp. KR1UV-12]